MQNEGISRTTILHSAFCILHSAFIFLLLAGCDRSTATPAIRPTVPPGTGVIRGVVVFEGKRPDPKVIGGDCCPGAAPAMDESMIINPDGTLKNVVIYIKNGPNLASATLKDSVLTQQNCQYQPHVMAVLTGQNVVVTSHDATIHNVHIKADANPSVNFSESQGASHAVHFDQPELVKFKCDVHPWMSANVYVFDHPCFAVTGEDGKFEIPNLPPGTYTLVAWQEKMLEQEMTVTVSADKPAEVKFEYCGE